VHCDSTTKEIIEPQPEPLYIRKVVSLSTFP
jgi:hypothetical protein